MSSFEKVKNGRSSPDDHKLIADLDEFLSEKYQIKIIGKHFELKPVIGKQLRALDEACGKTRIIAKKINAGENISYEEIAKTYHEFCKIVLPDLKLEDLSEMTVRQINELLNVCFKFATQHDLTEESDQKKNLLN